MVKGRYSTEELITPLLSPDERPVHIEEHTNNPCACVHYHSPYKHTRRRYGKRSSRIPQRCCIGRFRIAAAVTIDSYQYDERKTCAGGQGPPNARSYHYCCRALQQQYHTWYSTTAAQTHHYVLCKLYTAEYACCISSSHSYEATAEINLAKTRIVPCCTADKLREAVTCGHES